MILNRKNYLKIIYVLRCVGLCFKEWFFSLVGGVFVENVRGFKFVGVRIFYLSFFCNCLNCFIILG